MADNHLAFVGTFTDADTPGIHSYEVDTGTGELEAVAATAGGADPSFLAIDPAWEHLYAANATDEGAVTAFSIDRDTGELTELNRGPSGDAGPCHCSVDPTGTALLAAHYQGGSVSMLSIEDDGRIGEVTDRVEHGDSESDATPHPHSIYPGPENQFAYAPDLGLDRIAVYEMDLEAGGLEPADPPAVEVHDGAGPRHLDFHPNERFVYLINERDSTLTAFELRSGRLEEIETVDTLPDGFDGDNYPADIHAHPSGQWVYGSNRGHDSIAVFELDDDGVPTLVDHESTQGEWPRNFAIDPTGRYLFAENEDTDNIVGFRIEDDGEPLSARRIEPDHRILPAVALLQASEHPKRVVGEPRDVPDHRRTCRRVDRVTHSMTYD